MALIAPAVKAGATALAALAFAASACRGPDDSAPPAATDSAQASAPAPAADDWTVSIRGTRGIVYGMPASDAAAQLGGEWADTTGACDRLRPARAPAGLSFMVEQGRIVRVDVDSAGLATSEGATVGMSEAEIRTRYPGVRSMPHKYDERGRYLVVTSATQADSALRLIFETDGARVVRYRAGVVPQVEYVEGCS